MKLRDWEVMVKYSFMFRANLTVRLKTKEEVQNE